jgi:hypothetical protein
MNQLMLFILYTSGQILFSWLALQALSCTELARHHPDFVIMASLFAWSALVIWSDKRRYRIGMYLSTLIVFVIYIGYGIFP